MFYHKLFCIAIHTKLLKKKLYGTKKVVLQCDKKVCCQKKKSTGVFCRNFLNVVQGVVTSILPTDALATEIKKLDRQNIA